MKIQLGKLQGLVLLLLFFLSGSAFSDSEPSWTDFIAQLRKDAIADGIRSEVFDEAFQNIHAPSRSVLHLDKTQPEKRLSYLEYRNSRVDPYRITLGRQEYRRHQEVLNRISEQFGVNACFVVSIWGLETSYGRYKGKFPVIQSLATLAYNPRRSGFFRSELLMALHMLNDGQVKLSEFKGEWAGASGHCQFMPSTWFRYALDYDGTGRADIWNNTNDALASIANFLLRNGWHAKEPWALPVQLPTEIDNSLLTTKTTKTVAEWLHLGVRPLDRDLPANKDLLASVIYPEGGPAYMVFDNFKTD
jgi:membrane-bound lytic murein transglycosylase B